MSLNIPWKDATLIALDLETSGQYPIQSEICEIGAVKWKGGEIIDRYSTLIKPTRIMSPEVIKIHNITNEMVANAPSITEMLPSLDAFIADGYIMAHHAPFDIGFLTLEYEKHNMRLPLKPVFCTSLLSRRVIKGTENHKLQTLIKHFGIDGGKAHRADDDAKACLEVAFKCFEVVGPNPTLEDLFKAQNRKLHWSQYSIETLTKSLAFSPLVEACRQQKPLHLRYRGGSSPGTTRLVYPQGVVRSPTGDFLVASDEPGGIVKRFYLAKINECAVVD